MAKKKAAKGAKKKTAAIANKIHAMHEALGVAPQFHAVGGCFNQGVATQLVFSCTGVGAVSPDVPLGQLFPGVTQRQGFCGCVFSKAVTGGATVKPADIPCKPSTKISDVIDSISC